MHGQLALSKINLFINPSKRDFALSAPSGTAKVGAGGSGVFDACRNWILGWGKLILAMEIVLLSTFSPFGAHHLCSRIHLSLPRSMLHSSSCTCASRRFIELLTCQALAVAFPRSSSVMEVFPPSLTAPCAASPTAACTLKVTLALESLQGSREPRGETAGTQPRDRASDFK